MTLVILPELKTAGWKNGRLKNVRAELRKELRSTITEHYHAAPKDSIETVPSLVKCECSLETVEIKQGCTLSGVQLLHQRTDCIQLRLALDFVVSTWWIVYKSPDFKRTARKRVTVYKRPCVGVKYRTYRKKRHAIRSESILSKQQYCCWDTVIYRKCFLNSTNVMCFGWANQDIGWKKSPRMRSVWPFYPKYR